MVKPYKCGCLVEAPDTCTMCRKRVALRLRRKANPGGRALEGHLYRERHRSELNERSRAKYAADPSSKNAQSSRYHQAVTRLKQSGHSTGYFEAMMLEQNGCCAICDRPFTEQVRPAADHNHTTGSPRGILCIRCNGGLGWLEHTLTGKMLEYLEAWSDRHLEGSPDEKELQ